MESSDFEYYNVEVKFLVHPLCFKRDHLNQVREDDETKQIELMTNENFSKHIPYLYAFFT